MPTFTSEDRELLVNRPIKAREVKEKLGDEAKTIINYLTDVNKLLEGTPFKTGLSFGKRGDALCEQCHGLWL